MTQGNYASSDSDNDNSNLELLFNKKGQDGKEQTADTWVLVGIQKTVDVFVSKSLLENICNSVSSSDINCNASVKTVNKVGEFSGYGTILCHPKGSEKIVPPAVVKKKIRVTFSSLKANQCLVPSQYGSDQVLVESNQGLYFAD